MPYETVTTGDAPSGTSAFAASEASDVANAYVPAPPTFTPVWPPASDPYVTVTTAPGSCFSPLIVITCPEIATVPCDAVTRPAVLAVVVGAVQPAGTVICSLPPL